MDNSGMSLADIDFLNWRETDYYKREYFKLKEELQYYKEIFKQKGHGPVEITQCSARISKELCLRDPEYKNHIETRIHLELGKTLIQYIRENPSKNLVMKFKDSYEGDESIQCMVDVTEYKAKVILYEVEISDTN